MPIYSKEDVSLFNENLDKIIKEADNLRLSTIDPKLDTLWGIINTVKDFIIEKERKLYGGFALNLLLEMKNATEDLIYDKNDVEKWDLDFYSPSPIEDAIEIANRLNVKGYSHVRVIDAQHEETYKIYAETIDCADISYVPKNIYNRMPFHKYDRFNIVGPFFMMIDMFRVFSDPMTSYFRLEKSFNRFVILEKYFPIPTITKIVKIAPPDEYLNIAIEYVHNFLTNNSTCVVVGMYAYNHMIKESNMINSNTNYVDLNYYEAISIQFIKDATDLILGLKERFRYISDDIISHEEYYPFFQYWGRNYVIKCNGYIICRLFNHNKRCIPYNIVNALFFTDGKYEERKGKINIGSFSIQMLYCLINVMYARTRNDNESRELYYLLMSKMMQMKKYHRQKTQKSILMESLFQEFIMKCLGETFSPRMDKELRVERKKKEGKKYSFRYDPSSEKDREREVNYRFKNSSGNKINNENNLKLDKLGKMEENDDIEEEEK
jgi:hypothetical protein